MHIKYICKDCAEKNNGRLPRKAAPLYEELPCQVCGKIAKVIHPAHYNLTDKLISSIKCDKKPKRPLRHIQKAPTAHFLCEGCANKLGATKFRLQCATWQDTKCDSCGSKTRCTEPRVYDLKSGCLKKR